ncbi:MAG: SDR family oxidoreductase [Bacteroidales bacterium]|nr:SDR family oxidoreductase [Bacteroidales bacterium]
MEAYYKEGICYVCQKKLLIRHHFYKEMCPECGDFNFEKRNQFADLSNYTALVTGGRIKIGFETSIKLLRAGAKVIVTSRFPQDTFQRYSKIGDFEIWKEQIHIIGVDFRHIQSVELFIDRILNEFLNLNIIINNAAQTVRRPPQFYKHLLKNERESKLLQINKQVSDILSKCNSLVNNKIDFLPSQNHDVFISADLSQIPLLPEDFIIDTISFPKGKFDKDGQQVDRRFDNSWMLRLEDVNLIEFYEVLNVNLITPFLLNTKLKPLLSNNSRPSFIVNVTSMEGNFFAPRKNARHPHTNMAKAALNMMTRTAATQYSENNIYMNSVDTGWITNEKPFSIEMTKKSKKSKMAIDEVDGAARILDPIHMALNEKKFQYGKLYKNYFEYPW